MHKPALFLLPQVHKLFNSPIPYGFSIIRHLNGRVLPCVIQKQLLFTAERNTLLDEASDALRYITPDIVNAVMSCPATRLPVTEQKIGRDVFIGIAGNFLRSVRPLKGDSQDLDGRCTWIRAHDDQRNPLREYAQSRRIFRADTRITTDFLRTRAGLFSLIVFRAITFNSDFLSEWGRVFFTSLSDWRDTVQSVPAGIEICNMCAYGQPIAGRSMDHASVYWELVAQWEPWLATHPHPSFEDVKGFISATNFPQVGELLGMLVAEDLYYGGVCTAPQTSIFAANILHLGLGSARVLQLFNILPNMDQLNCEENEEALLDVYQDLLSYLEGEGEDDLMPDIIVFEHLCCKVYRAWKAGML